jgi:hypothetical protein
MIAADVKLGILDRTAARRSLIISNGVGDVAKYLSEAASSIFKTSESNVPWEGSGTPFSGGGPQSPCKICMCIILHSLTVQERAQNCPTLARQPLVYAGRITHHDEVSRLKKVYELVKDARQQVEGGPCMQHSSSQAS